MLSAAAFFLFLALLAAAVAFSNIPLQPAGLAKFLVIAFLAIAVVAFALGGRSRRPTRQSPPLRQPDPHPPEIVRYKGRELRPGD